MKFEIKLTFFKMERRCYFGTFKKYIKNYKFATVYNQLTLAFCKDGRI